MKPPAWSYTHLRDAEICLRQYHHKHILKDTPFVETEATRWGNTVHKAMEERLKTGAPLAKGMEAYEQFVPAKTGMRGLIEWWAGIREDGTACNSYGNEAWGKGKVDFALISADINSAIIIDWKTGKVREDPDELEIFAVLLKGKYPSLERITGWYVWLKEGRLGQVHDLSDTKGKLESIRGRVERLKQAAAMDAWEPRQNPLCGWCSIVSCEYNPKRN